MNTATFALVKTTSAVQRTSAIGRFATRYLKPRRCRIERSAISGRVSRLRFACITLRTAAPVLQADVTYPI
jgi:hypothetical protein